MEPSPYHPGARPAYLAGRGSALQTVDDIRARLRHLGRSGGPLTAFYGPRGYGKTSLLRQAQAATAEAGFLTGWVTGRSDRTMVETLAKSLSPSVRSVGDRAAALVHRLDKVQVEFGVPGAKIGAEVNTSSAGDVGNAGSDGAALALGELLEDTARFAANHYRSGLILFVDEFQEARAADRRSLLIALQEFDGDQMNPCPVAIVAAGLPSVYAAVTEAATFGERSRFLEVRGLNEVAVAEALRVAAERAQVRWSDVAIEVATEASGGYPHKVQLIGDAAWASARPERGGVVTEGHARAGAEAAETHMEQLFRTRWTAARPEHRRLLAAIAAGGGDTASRADIAVRLGVTSDALSRPREQLIARGLIEPTGHGKVGFTIPGFGAFVRRQEIQ